MDKAAGEQSPDTTITYNEVKPTGLKILIAEDDDSSEWLLSLSVKPFCKSLLIAHTGKEAVEICRNSTDIDLILMDIRMPEMDGIAATKQIRTFNKEIIIIAQSSYGLSIDKHTFIDAGFNEHISKPISKNELIQLLQKYFIR